MPKKILIDAGHYAGYGKSPCKTSPTYYEGNMTWVLCASLGAELKKYGFEVETTRADKNSDPGVFQRGQKARGCDLFVSLHSNTPGGKDDNKVNNSLDLPVIIIPLFHTKELETLAGKLGNVVHEFLGTTQIYKKKGYKIHTKKHPTWENLDYYGVLRGAVSVGCKNAMIIEHSFHTCEKTVNFLLKQENIDKLAAKEAEIIAETFGMKKTAETPQSETTVKAKYKEGDQYVIRSIDKYTNGKPVPSRYVGRTMTISKAKADGSAILIKELNSWIALK